MVNHHPVARRLSFRSFEEVFLNSDECINVNVVRVTRVCRCQCCEGHKSVSVSMLLGSHECVDVNVVRVT